MTIWHWYVSKGVQRCNSISCSEIYYHIYTSHEFRVSCPVLDSFLSQCIKSLGSVRVIKINILKKFFEISINIYPKSEGDNNSVSFLPGNLACNFDKGHTCNWNNARGDDFDWVVGSSTPTLTTGPARDHTTRRGKSLESISFYIKCCVYYHLERCTFEATQGLIAHRTSRKVPLLVIPGLDLLPGVPRFPVLFDLAILLRSAERGLPNGCNILW